MRYTRIRRGSAFQERDSDGRFRDQGRSSSPVGYSDNNFERYRDQDRNDLRDWREKRSEDYGENDDFGTSRGNRGSRSQNPYEVGEMGNRNYGDNERFNSGYRGNDSDDRYDRGYDNDRHYNSDNNSHYRDDRNSSFDDRDNWNRDRWNEGNSGYGSSMNRGDFRDFGDRREGYWRGRRSDSDRNSLRSDRRGFPTMPQEKVERIGSTGGRTAPGGGRTNSQRERSGRSSGVGSSTGSRYIRRSRGM